MYHNPIMLNSAVENLKISGESIIIDATFGGGGHSKEILIKMNKNCRLFAFDRDLDSSQNTINDNRFKLIYSNFRNIKNFLRVENIFKVDGILADLGLSSFQIDTPSRGFSIRFDGPLDMRMNQNQKLSAFDVVNNYEEDKLSEILFNNADLKNAKKIARQIVVNRKNKIKTTLEFNNSLKSFLKKGSENKTLAKIYQAIRIEVNDEIESLKDFLISSKDMLKKGGRLCIISYHSVEDRIMKRFFKNGNFKTEPSKDLYGKYKKEFKICGSFKTPDVNEIKINNRSRSAKLRVAERL